jgi:glycosyltransferase involved in cell wall biosynthesis
MKTSVIITSFKRANLLKHTLESICVNYPKIDFEIIIINDGIEDDTENVCNLYKDKLDIKYYFTGQRNLDKETWRCPSIPINYGVSKSNGDIIILSCAEMFQINDCIDLLSNPLIENPNLMTIPIIDDDDGNFLKMLEEKDYNQTLNLSVLKNNYLPFLMGVSRKKFLEIRGYDEEFSNGIGFEDNDFIDRMRSNGCVTLQTGARAIHLYHQHLLVSNMTQDQLLLRERNQQLYNKKRGF